MTEQENLRVAIATIAAQLPYISSELANVRSDVRAVKGAVDAVPTLIEDALKNYVRVEEFKPVRTIVFTTVGLVLTSVVAAVLALVIIKA